MLESTESLNLPTSPPITQPPPTRGGNKVNLLTSDVRNIYPSQGIEPQSAR